VRRAADAVALADELGVGSLLAHRALDERQGRPACDAERSRPGPPRGRAQTRSRPTKCRFDEDGWALFSGAAASRDNRAAIIDFTTGGRLPDAFVNHVVQHSLDNSAAGAFGAYLQSWAKTDFAERVRGNPAAVKVIVGEHDPALSAEVDGADLAWRLIQRGA